MTSGAHADGRGRWVRSSEHVQRHREVLLSRVASLADRFHTRYEFDPFGGCWLWSGALPEATGYGTIQHRGRTLGAHRVSFELHHRPLRADERVLHKCDVRACVNPDHLWAGSQRDNIRDMIIKGRRRCAVGDRHGSVRLTVADIPAIRSRLRKGEGIRSIGRSFGVSDGAIDGIRRGRTWWHVR